MKLATIALASAFVLSTTVAFAYTSHHHKYKTHHGTTYQGTVGMGSGGQREYGGGRYYGNPNDAGGLVGGSSNGTQRY